jgi:hypothetical protein
MYEDGGISDDDMNSVEDLNNSESFIYQIPFRFKKNVLLIL